MRNLIGCPLSRYFSKYSNNRLLALVTTQVRTTVIGIHNGSLIIPEYLYKLLAVLLIMATRPNRSTFKKSVT